MKTITAALALVAGLGIAAAQAGCGRHDATAETATPKPVVTAEAPSTTVTE